MSYTRLMPCKALTATICFAFSMSSTAFQVLPKISDVDRKLTNLRSNGLIDSLGQFVVNNAIPMIKSPVHESIALARAGC